MTTGPDANAIADAVLEAFDKLPAKCKPRPRTDGSREWIPLAGIVIAKGGKVECVSLGTGMKCLPTSKLALANGNVLHDWHAEVLALRAFNRFVLDECLAVLTPPYALSPYIVQCDTATSAPTSDKICPPFRIRDDVEIHMYCSEAPCGDASMELVMDAQEDATPWTSVPPTITNEALGTTGVAQAASGDEGLIKEEISALRGRSHFSLLGAVRLKPSRPDAPPTLSKSCTDKLSLKQCTSLLSSLTSLLISPRNAYLRSVVLPESQYVEAACLRAFSAEGRMAGINGEMQKRWGGGYTFSPFEVRSAEREFKYSRRSVFATEKSVPCNLSAVSTPHFTQTLIGGVLQGRKQFDARGASLISRRSTWKAAGEIAALVGVPLLLDAVQKVTYNEVKEGEMLEDRRRVKEDVRGALKGWVRNGNDKEWGIE